MIIGRLLTVPRLEVILGRAGAFFFGGAADDDESNREGEGENDVAHDIIPHALHAPPSGLRVSRESERR